jgi:hypothetical protein
MKPPIDDATLEDLRWRSKIPRQAKADHPGVWVAVAKLKEGVAIWNKLGKGGEINPEFWEWWAALNQYVSEGLDEDDFGPLLEMFDAWDKWESPRKHRSEHLGFVDGESIVCHSAGEPENKSGKGRWFDVISAIKNLQETLGQMRSPTQAELLKELDFDGKRIDKSDLSNTLRDMGIRELLSRE